MFTSATPWNSTSSPNNFPIHPVSLLHRRGKPLRFFFRGLDPPQPGNRYSLMERRQVSGEPQFAVSAEWTALLDSLHKARPPAGLQLRGSWRWCSVCMSCQSALARSKAGRARVTRGAKTLRKRCALAPEGGLGAEAQKIPAACLPVQSGDGIQGISQGNDGKLREGVQPQRAECLAEKYNVVIARDQGSPDEDHDRHNCQFHFNSPTKTSLNNSAE